ncbi:calpain-like protein [Strigomonas culicis]|uniref:Calpain-like protein n=1 Tax=Strigomonas culicis TaxID=28005 RepID=S9VD46_9TRYP|nr:calpain-like protein [Strigomonas culicis]|eukprot:EPY21015.1 calpain-like protein [Strigomonas culicis]
MLINGMTRMVTIDDRLPANPHYDHVLCAHSRDPTELWVSLMEKAFLKVSDGSYNFPSSSDSDLYKLCGWLPEAMDFADKDFNSEFEWSRMARDYGRGAVLLTISAGSEQRTRLERVQLVAHHAYAVLDLREVEGRRVLLVQNPWSKLSWSGPLSHTDKSPEAAKIREAFAVTEDVTNRGVFCIAWEDALRYFDRCFLSWNPYLLYPTPDGLSRRPTRLACHGTFAYTLSVGQMPQLHIGVVKAPRRQRMHLVFSRHVSNAKDVHLESDENDNTVPYVSLKVYDITEYPSIAQSIGGSCVFGMCYCRRLASSSDISVRMQPLNSVAYRKAASWLTSFDCPAGTSNLLVVVTRLGSPVKEPFNFTVTLHTELEQMRLPVLPQAGDAAAAATGSLMESANLTAGNLNAGVYMHLIPKTCLRCTTAVTGSFAKGKSCGGRMDGNTYVYNPQYVLTLTRPSMVSVRLSLPECDKLQLQLMQKWPPRDERVKAAKVPFGLRIGNGTSDASFIMRSRVYTYGGAVLDSALPCTLERDASKLLGDRQVKETQNGQPMRCLPPLPAGDYVVVPSLWERGVPASYELVVETTEAHTLRPLPEEGEGWNAVTVSGQLLQGGHLRSTTAPLQLQKSDAVFQCSKIAVSLAAKGLLTCRLFVVGGDAETESERTYVNVSLFVESDPATMQMVASSGHYSAGGVALPITLVERQGLLVVSAHPPSKNKYRLRLYSNVGLTAALTV